MPMRSPTGKVQIKSNKQNLRIEKRKCQFKRNEKMRSPMRQFHMKKKEYM